MRKSCRAVPSDIKIHFFQKIFFFKSRTGEMNKKNASPLRASNQPTLMSFFKKVQRPPSPATSLSNETGGDDHPSKKSRVEGPTAVAVPFSTVPVKRSPSREVVWKDESRRPPSPPMRIASAGGASLPARGGSSATPTYRHLTSDICPFFCRPCGCKRGSSCRQIHFNDFGHGVLRVPWSARNLYVSQSGKACRHWDLITAVVGDISGTPIRSSRDLEEFIITLYPPIARGSTIFPRNFESLIAVIDEDMTAKERKELFNTTLPWMRAQVVQAPSLFSQGIPLLLQGAATPASVTLNQLQVCVLIICCFFCLFPGRHAAGIGQFLGDNDLLRHARKLGYVNFSALFGTEGSQARGKIRCFLQYFQTAAQTFAVDGFQPTNIEIVRCARAEKAQDNSARLVSSSAPLLPVHVCSSGVIEDCQGVAQCDFANKVLGGGVLGRGCVQEEIRFAISPELLLSRILAEVLMPHEALVMNGAVQYCNYSGYAKTFAFAGPATIPPLSKQEASRRIRNICVVALDAIDFAHSRNLRLEHQFFPFWIEREVIKAYAAFVGAPSQLSASSSGPIATGNWGCGAFGGDLQLKFLIQWCAASAAQRPLEYFTFGNDQLANDLNSFVQKIFKKVPRTTSGELYSALMMYQAHKATATTATASAVLSSLTEDEDMASSLCIVDELDWLEEGGEPVADEPVTSLNYRSASSAGRPTVLDIVAKSLLES